VCDRCNRDGLLLQVVPIDSDLEAFVIVRCPKHAGALAAESNGAEPTGNDDELEVSGAVDHAARLVGRKPGRSSAQYVELGTTRYALGQAVAAGLVRAEGNTTARRYYPA
jgi:hypothetical protein